MPAGKARGWRRARQGDAVCRVQQDAVCRALLERVLSAVRGHCVCIELAGVCGVDWNIVVSWDEVQLTSTLELVVKGGR